MSGVAGTVRMRSFFDLANPLSTDIQEGGGVALAMAGGEIEIPLTPFGTSTVRFGASFNYAPIVLKVRKDPAAGDVILEWTGGPGPYRVLRSLERDLSGNSTILDPARVPMTYTDLGALAINGDFYYDID